MDAWIISLTRVKYGKNIFDNFSLVAVVFERLFLVFLSLFFFFSNYLVFSNSPQFPALGAMFMRSANPLDFISQISGYDFQVIMWEIITLAEAWPPLSSRDEEQRQNLRHEGCRRWRVCLGSKSFWFRAIKIFETLKASDFVKMWISSSETFPCWIGIQRCREL